MDATNLRKVDVVDGAVKIPKGAMIYVQFADANGEMTRNSNIAAIAEMDLELAAVCVCVKSVQHSDSWPSDARADRNAGVQTDN